MLNICFPIQYPPPYMVQCYENTNSCHIEHDSFPQLTFWSLGGGVYSNRTETPLCSSLESSLVFCTPVQTLLVIYATIETCQPVSRGGENSDGSDMDSTVATARTS